MTQVTPAPDARRRDLVDSIARNIAIILVSGTAQELAGLTKAPTIETPVLSPDVVVRGHTVTAKVRISDYDRAEYRLSGHSTWRECADGDVISFTASEDTCLFVRAFNNFSREAPTEVRSNDLRVIHPPEVNPYTFPAVSIAGATASDLATLTSDLRAIRLDWLDYDPIATAQTALQWGPTGETSADGWNATVVDLMASMQASVSEANALVGQAQSSVVPAIDDLAGNLRASTAGFHASVLADLARIRDEMRQGRGAGTAGP